MWLRAFSSTFWKYQPLGSIDPAGFSSPVVDFSVVASLQAKLQGGALKNLNHGLVSISPDLGCGLRVKNSNLQIEGRMD